MITPKHILLYLLLSVATTSSAQVKFSELKEINEEDFNYNWSIEEVQKYMADKCLDKWVVYPRTGEPLDIKFAGVKFHNIIGFLEFTIFQDRLAHTARFMFTLDTTPQNDFIYHKDTANVLSHLQRYDQKLIEQYFHKIFSPEITKWGWDMSTPDTKGVKYVDDKDNEVIARVSDNSLSVEFSLFREYSKEGNKLHRDSIRVLDSIDYAIKRRMRDSLTLYFEGTFTDTTTHVSEIMELSLEIHKQAKSYRFGGKLAILRNSAFRSWVSYIKASNDSIYFGDYQMHRYSYHINGKIGRDSSLGQGYINIMSIDGLFDLRHGSDNDDGPVEKNWVGYIHLRRKK